MNWLTPEHLAWSFALLCAIGIAVNAPVFWIDETNDRFQRWLVRIDLIVNLGLVAWSILMFTSLPNWVSQ